MAKIIQFWNYNDTSGVMVQGMPLECWNIHHQVENGVQPQIRQEYYYTWPPLVNFGGEPFPPQQEYHTPFGTFGLRGSEVNPWGDER